MSKAAATVIELFYDVISPYSYLAFEVMARYKTKWNVNLQLKPFLIAGIMKGSGNSPPATVPNKAVYMRKDLDRLQTYFQVPIVLPSNLMDIMFNKGSLKAQRFITAIDMKHPEYTEEISRSLWKRLYETHEDIFEEESFRAAGKSIGMSDSILEDAIKSMTDQKVKDRLQLYTKQALDYGAFGAPLIVAHKDGKPVTFFGSDRFELLAHIIDEKWEGPVPSSKM